MLNYQRVDAIDVWRMPKFSTVLGCVGFVHGTYCQLEAYEEIEILNHGMKEATRF